jgi:hypothetical protein
VTRNFEARNVLFALIGAAALVLKGHYSGPFEELVFSYAGNVTASFAVYFIVGFLPFDPRFRKLLSAGVALLVVQLFEALDGFGVMTNVYDRIDFAANAVGIGLALLTDVLASRINACRHQRSG